MNFFRLNRDVGPPLKRKGRGRYTSRSDGKPTEYAHRRRHSCSSSEDEYNPKLSSTRSTFGIFISPSNGKGFASLNSSICPCTCCPHSSSTRPSASARTTRQRQRHGSGRHIHHEDNPNADQSPQSYRCGPSLIYHRHGGGRHESTKKKEVPSERHRLINIIRGGTPTAARGHDRKQQSRNGRAEHKGTWSIDVVDRTDKSRSKHHDEYGKRFFALSLSRNAAATDIMDQLAPDGQRNKVVVHWKDGAQEDFDEYISIRDIRNYAASLEVKRRKTVHWRYNPA